LIKSIVNNNNVPEPPVRDLKFRKCTDDYNWPRDCISVGYFVFGEPSEWTNFVLKYFAKHNELELGKDVK